MDAFAINAKILIAQIVNFSIILFVLAKYAYKPIVAMFEERKNKIAQGLIEAEKAAETLAESENKAKEIEAKAYRQAEKIIAQASASAKKEADQVIKRAENQAAKIIGQAETEAKLAKSKALSQAKRNLGTLVMIGVEKILGEKLDQAKKERLTAKAIKDL
jgi:F-type H+-transporting ATPase subunit b